MTRRIFGFFRPFSLPLLLAVYPPLFHYGNNASILLITSLSRMVLLNVLFALGLQIILFFTFRKSQPIQIANATSLFLIFFNLYGIFYKYLLELDLVQIEHFTLLPLIILIALYIAWLITKLNNAHSHGLWKHALLVLSLLVAFNIIKSIPAEIQKLNASSANTIEIQGEHFVKGENYPDIYFILLDEFAGFEPMRQYWHYQGVDDFDQFLKSKGFFVAENSHGSSIDTLHQMAIRLNYQDYPLSSEYVSDYYNAIADNKVMRELKSRGYTTVVFDETQLGYPAKPPVLADYSYEFGSKDISHIGIQSSVLASWGIFFDEFGELVADNTMLLAFSNIYKEKNPLLSQHKDMIYFAVNKIGNLSEVPSPKFVYAHLLFPHYPFMFDANGNINNSDAHYNWDYYLGNYQFAIKMTEEMVKNILTDANPNRLPIIILQSDHGARNILVPKEGGKILQNYPDEYKTFIMNTMYIPGYDFSKIPQNVNPINTFPIIFNYLFDANIPLK